MPDILDDVDDFKYPDTPVPDQDIVFPEGQYSGIVGKLGTFYAGRDGKKAAPDDTFAALYNIIQELWILEYTEDFEKPTQKLVPRITIKNGVVTFVRGDAHGVKMLESFPTPSNVTKTKSGKTIFEALGWKARAFYNSFEGVIIGGGGNKRVVWEAVKQFYGCSIMFNVKYTAGETKTYRNFSNVKVYPIIRFDAEIMAKIETLYHQLKAVENNEKVSGTKPVNEFLSPTPTQTQQQSAPIDKVDDLPF